MFSAARHPEQGDREQVSALQPITSLAAAYPLAAFLRVAVGAYPRRVSTPRWGFFWAG